MDGVDLDTLRGWMDQRGLGSGPLEAVSLLSGGTQNILLSFTRAGRAGGAGRAYVLRRPPVHLRANSNETMRREARVLGALAGTNVPHPALIDACADETVLGAAFTLMEKIDGFNATTGLPALHADSVDCRHAMGLALVDGIAALGALDYRALGLEGFGRPDDFLARQVARWGAQLASYSALPGWPGAGHIPGVARVAAWLEANRPAAFAPGLMHGDYHLANVLFRLEGPALAAIVDWELATIGDPLVDLGWLLATWPDDNAAETGTVLVRPWSGFPSAAELVARYRALSPRDVSAVGWYAVLACYKLGIILEGTYARACAGQAPRETGDALHSKSVLLFERALRWIG